MFFAFAGAAALFVFAWTRTAPVFARVAAREPEKQSGCRAGDK